MGPYPWHHLVWELFTRFSYEKRADLFWFVLSALSFQIATCITIVFVAGAAKKCKQEMAGSSNTATNSSLLVIEPFYGGSHQQLIDTLLTGLRCQDTCSLYTLPAKKWHWRARTSALHFAQVVPTQHNYRILFASSVLCLSELISLRPDLGKLTKVLYFHENQLAYPVQEQTARKERDFQYGYNQILSCLVADIVVFNSKYNRDSFLSSIKTFFKLQPDHRPKGLKELIEPKCRTVYFPLKLEPCSIASGRQDGPLRIVWPHRWEHDKGPDMFFEVLFRLIAEGLEFQVAVLGQCFSEIPPIFDEAKTKLASRITHWGFLASKLEYETVLSCSDVTVSTALHEFFGVSTLEAVWRGCLPLCPNRLAYPETLPAECLYNTTCQLTKKLKYLCRHPNEARRQRLTLSFDIERFSWEHLRSDYENLLMGKTQPSHTIS